MSRTDGHTTEQVIEAIRKHSGIISAAARELGVTRRTVQRYVAKYPTVARALEEARDTTIDLAESQLIRAVSKGSLPAIMFLLKTVGRTRGYVERQEVQHDGSVNIIVSWDGDDNNQS